MMSKLTLICKISGVSLSELSGRQFFLVADKRNDNSGCTMFFHTKEATNVYISATQTAAKLYSLIPDALFCTVTYKSR